MKLMTKELLKAFAKVEGEGKMALAKFFDPCGSWTWYAAEFDPATGVFFGLVNGFECEYGSFSLAELEKFRNKLGLGIERDLYYTPQSLASIHFALSCGEHV